MPVANELLCDNKWLQLRQIVCPEEEVKGYTFSHEVRCRGLIVLVVPFKRDGKRVIVAHRMEVTPCWGMDAQCSGLTGGAEPDDDSAECALTAARELKEEAGYDVSANDLIWLGRCRASKSSDTWYLLWAADVTDVPQGAADGDGSKQDSEGTIGWQDIECVHSQDAQFTTACVRLQHFLKEGG